LWFIFALLDPDPDPDPLTRLNPDLDTDPDPQPCLKEGNILLQLITALRPPLQLKYACVKQSSWRIAIEVSRG
jgi:hypothetical protein